MECRMKFHRYSDYRECARGPRLCGYALLPKRKWMLYVVEFRVSPDRF
jgi:hypothetical protein